jgi:hypothetical protein
VAAAAPEAPCDDTLLPAAPAAQAPVIDPDPIGAVVGGEVVRGAVTGGAAGGGAGRHAVSAAHEATRPTSRVREGPAMDMTLDRRAGPGG